MTQCLGYIGGNVWSLELLSHLLWIQLISRVSLVLNLCSPIVGTLCGSSASCWLSAEFQVQSLYSWIIELEMLGHYLHMIQWTSTIWSWKILMWFISQHMRTSSRRMIWFSYQMTRKVAPSKALLLQSRNIRVVTQLMMDSLLPSSLKHQALCLRMAPTKCISSLQWKISWENSHAV